MPTLLLVFSSSGKVNFTVTAEVMELEGVCTESTAVMPESGGKDTVVRHLLVKVRVCFRVLARSELSQAQNSPVGGSGRGESAGQACTLLREADQRVILRVDLVGGCAEHLHSTGQRHQNCLV